MANITVTFDIDQTSPATIISTAIIVIAFYLIGIFLHTKIVIVCREEKDLTWKIDIMNSICVMIIFTFKIFIYTITYMVEDLYIYTGKWLCYTSKFIFHFTLLYNGGHSMIISLIKYCIIVHDDQFRHLKDELKRAFFWINIFLPFIQVALQVLLVPDFYLVYGGWEPINKCLGDVKYSKSTWWVMCDFDAPPKVYSLQYIAYVIRKCVCKSQVIFIYMIGFNILDMFFYCRIFATMRR